VERGVALTLGRVLMHAYKPGDAKSFGSNRVG
jgi:hypothetical protein